MVGGLLLRYHVRCNGMRLCSGNIDRHTEKNNLAEDSTIYTGYEVERGALIILIYFNFV